ERAVGADLGHDRRGPGVVAGEDIPTVLGDVAAALRDQPIDMDEVAGRLTYERGLVPALLGKTPRRIEGVARGCRESAVEIDLTDVAGYGVELLVVLDPGAALAVPAAHTLIDMVGDGELNSVHVIRGGGEDFAGLAYAQAPRVVGGGGHELE